VTDTLQWWASTLAGPEQDDNDAGEFLEQARAGAREASWNTLLSGPGQDASMGEAFGSLLVRKWHGVSTASA